MKRDRKKKRGNVVRLRVWTHAQGRAVLPYLSSVLTSLREHRLNANRHALAAKRLAERPGRPDRAALLAQEDALAAARRAEQHFEEAQRELNELDIYCLDAVNGQALIPFVHDKQLAWFVYDLFDSQPLRYWRYQTDPLETRRPVEEAEAGRGETSLVV